jgi:hypothetical protein
MRENPDRTPAPTPGPTPASPPQTYDCPVGTKLVQVDFNGFEARRYVDVLVENTLFVEAIGNGGYTPGGKARIFDSANPTGGDRDLGSPNKSCGGPGEGKGGKKGMKGENCKALGKLLIIQETKKRAPDDNAKGGKLIFSTTPDKDLIVLRIGVIDIDEAFVTLDVNGPVKYEGLGNNAFQELVNENPTVFVNRFEVDFTGSGAVAYLVSSFMSGHFGPCLLA